MIIYKQFFVFFIQCNSSTRYIFFPALSFTVYLTNGLSVSVIHKNITVISIVCDYDIFLAYCIDMPLIDKFIVCFQRNVFHIHEVLKNQFLLGIRTFGDVDGDKPVVLLLTASGCGQQDDSKNKNVFHRAMKFMSDKVYKYNDYQG